MATDLLPVTGSKILHSGLAFAYAAIVAKLLGPTAYGLFAVSLAVTAIAAEITGQGLEVTMVRIVARSGAADRPELASPAYRAVFKLKLLVNGVLAIAGWLAAEPVSALLGDPAYRLPIQLGACGALGFSLWRLVLAVLQSQQAFGAYAVVQSAAGVFKMVALGLLLILARIELHLLLIVHVSSFFVGFLIALLFVPRESLPRRLEKDPGAWRSVVAYGKWIVGASLLAGVNAWLAVLAVGYFVGTRAAGEYAAAHMLIGACDVLMISLNTVLLPIACRVATRSAGTAYLKQAFRVSGLLSAALLPGYFLAGPLVALVYSQAFEASVPVLRILFWGFLVSLNVHPALLILHSKNRPEVVAGLECFKLVLHALACALLIPRLAVVGAALATTLSRLAGGTAGLFLVHAVLRHQPRGER